MTHYKEWVEADAEREAADHRRARGDGRGKQRWIGIRRRRHGLCEEARP